MITIIQMLNLPFNIGRKKKMQLLWHCNRFEEVERKAQVTCCNPWGDMLCLPLNENTFAQASSSYQVVEASGNSPRADHARPDLRACLASLSGTRVEHWMLFTLSSAVSHSIFIAVTCAQGDYNVRGLLPCAQQNRAHQCGCCWWWCALVLWWSLVLVIVEQRPLSTRLWWLQFG